MAGFHSERRNLKVLLHTPFFHPSVVGIETFAAGLAGELHRRGVDVTVLA